MIPRFQVIFTDGEIHRNGLDNTYVPRRTDLEIRPKVAFRN
jgi:hypothetical protein